jgi:hypothetical protein
MHPMVPMYSPLNVARCRAESGQDSECVRTMWHILTKALEQAPGFSYGVPDELLPAGKWWDFRNAGLVPAHYLLHWLAFCCPLGGKKQTKSFLGDASADYIPRICSAV